MYFFYFSKGDCDVAETCNGVSGNCPADAFKSQWALCPGGAKKPGHDCDEFVLFRFITKRMYNQCVVQVSIQCIIVC